MNVSASQTGHWGARGQIPTYFRTGVKVDKERSGPNGIIVRGPIKAIRNLENGLYVTAEQVPRRAGITDSRIISTQFVTLQRSKTAAPDAWILQLESTVRLIADPETSELLIHAGPAKFVAQHLKALGFEGSSGVLDTRPTSRRVNPA